MGELEKELQRLEKRSNKTYEGNLIIAEFLGYAYYPKVEGEEHPGVWCVKEREEAIAENKQLKELLGYTSYLSPSRGYGAYLGRNRRSIDFLRWDRLMDVAKQVEFKGEKVKISTDIYKSFDNVVDAIKKL
jgi:hypothetical protein